MNADRYVLINEVLHRLDLIQMCIKVVIASIELRLNQHSLLLKVRLVLLRLPQIGSQDVERLNALSLGRRALIQHLVDNIDCMHLFICFFEVSIDFILPHHLLPEHSIELRM